MRQRQIKTLRAIRRLNPTLRAPIRMHMTHGWSVREISQALNISESAVKSRLYRARQQLSTSRNGANRFTTEHDSGSCQGNIEIGEPSCKLAAAQKN